MCVSAANMRNFSLARVRGHTVFRRALTGDRASDDRAELVCSSAVVRARGCYGSDTRGYDV